MSSRSVRIAIEGCGHGTLHAIYASVEQASKAKGWDGGPDLVIIGGDFQAVRNASDLMAMSVPQKYREIGDFHEYYSGRRTAPYLTIFVGGNHEASNHLFELYYGGWAAPNIYYLGAANVLRFGPLRIAGISGIWKGYNYRKPHYERLPYTAEDVKSIYHVRELDVRKLLKIRTQVDIGLSHDWPQGIEWSGDWAQLFRFRPYFEDDAKTGRLGSPAARYILDRLRPVYWFSAHLHCKFSAVLDHNKRTTASKVQSEQTSIAVSVANEDEINIDLDEEEDQQEAKVPGGDCHVQPTLSNQVSENLRAQLPESFAKSTQSQSQTDEVPEGITNNLTHFLALDKCLPRRKFLQLIEVQPCSIDGQGLADQPYTLSYDPEWLAITKAFASELSLGDRRAQVPRESDRHAEIASAMQWVQENVVQKSLLSVPANFEPTAPFYNDALGIGVTERPDEYTNPQTMAFCNLLEIENKFHLSDEERQRRVDDFAEEAGTEAMANDRYRGSDGGRRGGGRGGRGRGRGRGGGRAFARKR